MWSQTERKFFFNAAVFEMSWERGFFRGGGGLGLSQEDVGVVLKLPSFNQGI